MKTYFLSSFVFIAIMLTGFGNHLSAQENPLEYRIHPIWVEARVLGILEDHNNLVVLQITGTGVNDFNLGVNSEILTEFYFGTAPTDGDPKLAGVKSGDMIRAEIHGKFNPSSGQWDYRVFRYNPAPSKSTAD